jgi:very-short-patch-repair endonuclease
MKVTIMFKNNLQLKSRRRSLRANQTQAETELWQRLRAKRFFGHKLYRQYSVGNFILVFFCRALGLAIEVNGGQHAECIDYDHERTEYLKSNNITVLRFWNNDVMNNLDGVLTEIYNFVSKTGNPS